MLKRAEVRVGDEVVGRIGHGLVILLGVGKLDTEAAGEALAEKIVNLRVFDDAEGKTNLSLLEAGGQVLCISQFTLYGDCRKGRRPSYDQAAPPDSAIPSSMRSFRQISARARNPHRNGPFPCHDGRGTGQRRTRHAAARFRSAVLVLRNQITLTYQAASGLPV